LIDSVFLRGKTPLIEDARKRGRNTLNPDNFQQKGIPGALEAKSTKKACKYVAFDTA